MVPCLSLSAFGGGGGGGGGERGEEGGGRREEEGGREEGGGREGGGSREEGGPGESLSSPGIGRVGSLAGEPSAGIGVVPCESLSSPMNPLRGSGVSERSRCGAVRILELAGEPSETDLWHDAPEKRSELAQREKKGKEKKREREREIDTETEQTKGATHATGQQHKHTLTTLTK